MNKLIKKTAILLCAVLLLCTALASCQSNKDENNIAEGDTVLSANGHDVSYGLYRYFFLNYKAAYTKDELSSDAAGVYSKIEEDVFEALRGMYAVIDMCAEYGISTDSSDIKAQVNSTINSIKEQYIDEADDPKGEVGFAADLKANFMTEDVLRYVTAVDACEAELFTKLVSEGKITSDADELKSAVEGDEFIRVVQIYINAENGRTYEENKELADSVLAKAVGGADFDELIGSYSNDYAMTKDGYYICRGYMNEKFEAVAFALDVGEISSVLEMSDGFHIIKRIDKDSEYINMKYDELAERYQTCIFYEMINQRTNAITITKGEKFTGIKPELIALG